MNNIDLKKMMNEDLSIIEETKNEENRSKFKPAISINSEEYKKFLLDHPIDNDKNKLTGRFYEEVYMKIHENDDEFLQLLKYEINNAHITFGTLYNFFIENYNVSEREAAKQGYRAYRSCIIKRSITQDFEILWGYIIGKKFQVVYSNDIIPKPDDFKIVTNELYCTNEEYKNGIFKKKI